VSLVARTPVLVLETTRRRSGGQRESTLAYLPLDDGQLLVVGGAGGQPRLPDWVAANLRANPEVTVTVNRERRLMHAAELDGAERATAWKSALAEWPRIASYESKAGRSVPVIRLVPRA
jgi:deazaflavin-dependent oxidoreductase (nitroreductase family)